MRPVAVLRPEPGNAATCARIEARGWRPLALPLFAVRPLDWALPDLGDIDTLLLTSANTLRHAGPTLAALLSLPVVAVGEATAAAARAAGFRVALTGAGNAGDAVAQAEQEAPRRWLHLGGREHRLPPAMRSIAVYASEPLTVDPAPLAGTVALLHSPRAAARLAALAAPFTRPTIRVAAISPAAAMAAGSGWDALAIAARPTDAALLEAAAALVD